MLPSRALHRPTALCQQADQQVPVVTLDLDDAIADGAARAAALLQSGGQGGEFTAGQRHAADDRDTPALAALGLARDPHHPVPGRPRRAGTAIAAGQSGSDLDRIAINQYNASLRYWESCAKAADLCEAIGYILGNFNRINSVGGKSWTREDLTKLLDKAEDKRESLTPASTSGGRSHFTRGRAR